MGGQLSVARRRSTLPLSYRFAVLSRVLAAIVGGYALAITASMLLVSLLHLSRADAVLTGMLSSFIFYAAAVIWVFAAATATRAWLGVVLPSAACFVLWWLLRP